jgi:hypothetical protein
MQQQAELHGEEIPGREIKDPPATHGDSKPSVIRSFLRARG